MAVANYPAIGLVEQEVARQLEAKRSNHEWLLANKEALRRRFPDKYVAVLDGEVIAAGKDLDLLFRQLRSKLKGRDLSTVAVDLITTQDVIWSL